MVAKLEGLPHIIQPLLAYSEDYRETTSGTQCTANCDVVVQTGWCVCQSQLHNYVITMLTMM